MASKTTVSYSTEAVLHHTGPYAPSTPTVVLEGANGSLAREQPLTSATATLCSRRERAIACGSESVMHLTREKDASTGAPVVEFLCHACA